MSESIRPATDERERTRCQADKAMISDFVSAAETFVPVNTPPMMAQTPVRKCVNDLSGAAQTADSVITLIYLDTNYLN